MLAQCSDMLDSHIQFETFLAGGLANLSRNEYVTIAVNRNLSNCEIAGKKVFRGFNEIRTRGLCVHAAVLYQLSYEDPYTESRPIY